MAENDAQNTLYSAKWYKDILDAISDMILVKGDRSKLLWANKAFLEYYGMSNEELQNIIDAPHSDPDDTIQYVKDDHYVFTTGKTLDVSSEPVTNASGHTAYFHTIKNAIHDDDSAIVSTVGVSRKIKDDSVVNESEKARQEQKSSLNELRLLVKNIPLAVAMLDVKQRFLCTSDQWETILGYKGDSIVGRFYDDIFEKQFPLAQQITEAVKKGAPIHIESLDIQIGSAKPIIVEINIHPWFLPSRDIGGTIVLVNDITHLKQSEANLRRLNEELTQFNYRVSHDLVSPLRSIKGYIGICQLEMGKDPERVKELHEKVIAKVDHLSELVQDVLNLSRADIKDEVFESVNLSKLIEQLLSEHSENINAADITIELNMEHEIIESSQFRLQQIMENLLSNSIKYFDESEKKRFINISCVSKDAGTKISISDNGIGFDDSLRETIFNMFVRGGSKHPGNGLGLYLVQKHVEKLGGQIDISSNRKNTVFDILLPNRSS